MQASLFFLYGLGNIGGVVLIISAIVGRVDKYRRMIHDRVCKTFVVSREVEEAIEKVQQEGRPRLARTAIFALILSIFAFAIPFISQLICFYVCGRVLYDIKQSKGLLKGKPLAIAGIVISVAYLIFFLFLFIIPSSAFKMKCWTWWRTTIGKKYTSKYIHQRLGLVSFVFNKG